MVEEVQDLPATVAPITIYRGDTKEFLSVIFYDPPKPDGSKGDPLDVSSWAWIAQWRSETTSTEYLSLIVDTSEAEVGCLHIIAPASVTAQMRGGGVWDLQAHLPDGTVKTKLKGKTKLLEDVSRT